ncbi:hypothetical protein Sjap_020118 [Stephania japonica]|uniref:Uncharacterized protein n=1 Tax=Stephania japonica TaxID=461633 RepID=A0AAP0F930_9MAGN
MVADTTTTPLTFETSIASTQLVVHRPPELSIIVAPVVESGKDTPTLTAFKESSAMVEQGSDFQRRRQRGKKVRIASERFQSSDIVGAKRQWPRCAKAWSDSELHVVIGRDNRQVIDHQDETQLWCEIESRESPDLFLMHKLVGIVDGKQT